MARSGTRSNSGSTMPDLDNVVTAATAGDQNAFVKLWQFFYPRLLHKPEFRCLTYQDFFPSIRE